MTDETRTPAPDDEKLGELLRRHAALYNEPPATPREALWARIEAERRKAGGGQGEDGRGQVIPLAPRRWWLGTLAVAAVLALGIALGRISMRQEEERQGATGPPVASVETPGEKEPETGAVEQPAVEPRATTPGEMAAAPDAATEPAGPTPAEQAPEREPEPAPRQVAPERVPPRQLATAPEAGPARTPDASPTDLYRLASQQMLGQAEALLIQYRTDRAADRMDPAIGRWARDVLSSTRLLLDSPAADDPGMRDLLEDLELVLAQIVQRTGQADPLNDQMIDQTIEDRDLLPRLRGAIPVGVGAI
ncbi:MAG TPA: hypothetical protein VFH69_03570 [Gemmatimonadota bacterium]|nr:hypothetical protein [Gemmatimonadota bacterium]